jgi:hypothetical protein
MRRPTDSSESIEDVERWFRERVCRLWPAGLGSLTLRRSPCIREGCHACQTGEQHPSYVLYGRRNGRRVTVYVPDRLVPEVRKAVENGRALQDLLYEAGHRYARALKRERTGSR